MESNDSNTASTECPVITTSLAWEDTNIACSSQTTNQPRDDNPTRRVILIPLPTNIPRPNNETPLARVKQILSDIYLDKLRSHC